MADRPATLPPPSFAQTGQEFSLDSDIEDDSDLRLEAGGGGDGDPETYELTSQDAPPEPTEAPAWETGEPRPTSLVDSDDVVRKELYSRHEEQAVRRKFDRRLVVFVALLYMLSFLDRSNIGNARIAGMDDDLQTNPPNEDWYGWALSAFYITYILFEWMSLMWKIVPAHIYVSVIVLSWGIIASLQAVATSYPMLIALRVLLGIGEAGFTGIPFYLSFFFKRQELAFRTAIFISAAPLATSFASTLAYVIVSFARVSPIAPWRLLFLLEGFPSVIVSVIAWHVVPDSPQTASYLTKREKKVAMLRLRSEQPSDADAKKPASGIRGRDLIAVLRDPIAWMTASMFFLTNMAFSSLPVFLPKIMTEMGHDTLSSQALSAPPYLLAFVVVLCTAYLSDKRQARTIPLVIHALLSAVGYGTLAFAELLNVSPTIRYLAIYPAAVGFFNVVTLIITWSINNQASQTRQGGGFAMLQVLGQCGPLIGTRLYPDSDAPYYTPGMRTCAFAMLVVAILATVLRIYLQFQNRKMDRLDQEKEADGTTTAEEEGLVGPGRRKKTAAERFRYML